MCPLVTADDLAPELYAVAAHGLLNSLTVVRTSAELALDPGVGELRRRQVLDRLLSQVDLMAGVLEELARCLPASAWDVEPPTRLAG